MNMDDLAPLLVAAGGPELAFRAGTVLTWDPVTGHNTVDVAGAVLEDLPLLNIGELVAIQAGDVVGLLAVKSGLFVLGRIIVPGDAPVAGLAQATATAYAEQTNGAAFSGAWASYGPGNSDARVRVPDGFTHAHVTLFVSAGVTFTASGNLSVQPTVETIAGRLRGPAINSGNASGANVAASFWAHELDVTPGDLIQFGADVATNGAAYSAGSGNWHIAASVSFTR